MNNWLREGPGKTFWRPWNVLEFFGQKKYGNPEKTLNYTIIITWLLAASLRPTENTQ